MKAQEAATLILVVFPGISVRPRKGKEEKDIFPADGFWEQRVIGHT